MKCPICNYVCNFLTCPCIWKGRPGDYEWATIDDFNPLQMNRVNKIINDLEKNIKIVLITGGSWIGKTHMAESIAKYFNKPYTIIGPCNEVPKLPSLIDDWVFNNVININLASTLIINEFKSSHFDIIDKRHDMRAKTICTGNYIIDPKTGSLLNLDARLMSGRVSIYPLDIELFPQRDPDWVEVKKQQKYNDWKTWYKWYNYKMPLSDYFKKVEELGRNIAWNQFGNQLASFDHSEVKRLMKLGKI